MEKENSKLGTIISWIYSIFCIMTLPVYGFNLGTVIFALLGIAALPVKPIKALWKNITVNKKWFKPVVLAVLFVVAVFLIPEEIREEVNNKNKSTTEVSAENSTTTYSKVDDISSEEDITMEQSTTIESEIMTEKPTTAEKETTTEQPTTTKAQEIITTTAEATTSKIEEKTVQQQTASSETQQNSAIIGNKNTKAYHRPTCNRLPKEKNRRYFDSEAEANAAGYDNPCDYCNP